MDWAEDCTGIREEDFQRVWRYDQKATTVIHLTSEDEAPTIRSFKTNREWKEYLESPEFPCIDHEDVQSGLVLILAKRRGEHEFTIPGQTLSSNWISQYEDELPGLTSDTRVLTFASLAEKSSTYPISQGQRSVRSLPFSEETFRLISKHYHVHHSISSVVSRADVPAFFSAEVEMEMEGGNSHMAEVYHTRTTNAWEMDLALTATHFPHRRLTYAVLFGCPLSVEAEVISRLSRVRSPEAAHPLVLAGIFAELERSRHVATIEAMIDKLENQIFELDISKAHHAEQEEDEEEKARKQLEKRDDYLDTAYLRNGLTSWRNQLVKIRTKAEELEAAHYGPNFSTSQSLSRASTQVHEDISRQDKDTRKDDSETKRVSGRTGEAWASDARMRRVGRKITGRLQAIIDEYDDKIRDCSMRLDGMEMATQWAQGETNVEIALATGRDSKHMRSIAIVTMVFLPGTFFASVFSMSFFTWFNDDTGSSEAKVSSYIWIYISFTVVATVLTIGLWYYFNMWRRAGKSKSDDEGEEVV